MTITQHAERNRAMWNRMAEEYARHARANWASEPSWGVWDAPEAEVRMLPEEVAGLDVVELGCGTAYVSAWLARLGARVTGVDLSERQLETARRMQQEFALEFPLVHASAEDVPLPDESFDFVVSEYGASIWCDPYLWIPEAARLLRPGGRLAFLKNGKIVTLTWDEHGRASEGLRRDYFAYRFEWADDGSVEFHLGYGDWIRLLRANGFELDELVELQAPADADPTRHGDVTPEWAHRWPAEEVWKATKPCP